MGGDGNPTPSVRPVAEVSVGELAKEHRRRTGYVVASGLALAACVGLVGSWGPGRSELAAAAPTAQPSATLVSELQREVIARREANSAAAHLPAPPLKSQALAGVKKAAPTAPPAAASSKAPAPAAPRAAAPLEPQPVAAAVPVQQPRQQQAVQPQGQQQQQQYAQARVPPQQQQYAQPQYRQYVQQPQQQGGYAPYQQQHPAFSSQQPQPTLYQPYGQQQQHPEQFAQQTNGYVYYPQQAQQGAPPQQTAAQATQSRLMAQAAALEPRPSVRAVLKGEGSAYTHTASAGVQLKQGG
eukprot:CAMPEP_0174927168 /NCGR_PEP_ID=MMETSP1355-20121228/17992_1 /TAXON_ID=464990 /ORGANISM="Hemiselmis tepida, Strain CCMP443" /LENGTH=296 /DNA_ID=CAMNT_0016173257 /DNA_START=8 /DNA_END=894 /DNA_ORIENTATION=+